MNKVLPDPPLDPAKDRAAFNRAIDRYLPRQALGVGVQLGAECIVAGHQQCDSMLHAFGLDGAGKIQVAANVVQRRIAHAQLVEPNVLLGASEGEAGRQAGGMLHKILLMGGRHWPRRGGPLHRSCRI